RLGEPDVRAAPGRVVHRYRPVHDPRTRTGEIDDALGEIDDRHLAGVAEVERSGQAGRGEHEFADAFDQVVHVAERARLRAVAVNRERLVAQRLHDEIGDDAAIVQLHLRPEGVEDARDLDLHAVHALEVEKRRFRGALAFVVAGARTDRRNGAAVVLALRVHFRLAVHLAGRGLEDARFVQHRLAQHVERTIGAGAQGL